MPGMSEERKQARRWTLTTVIGAIFVVTSALIFLGVYTGDGHRNTDFYTPKFGIGFLIVGAAMICRGMLTNRKGP